MENKNKLIDLFIANSNKIIAELEKGKDVCIKKNKNGYSFYSTVIKRISNKEN